MSSLKQQLEKLKINQKADPILPENASATFLFDFKNSNKIDKETIFEIGYSAIIELSKINRKFIKYIPTLFNNTSKYFQRETKMHSELTEIDKNLENLIIDLIDFFHLKASHKILEYLIKIYSINTYAQKLLILAFLPYHESKYFVKLIQNCNFNLFQNFKFLGNYSTGGIVLLKELLYKEIFGNFEFLKEIFNFYEEKIYKNSEINIQKNLKKEDSSNNTFGLNNLNNYNSCIESKKYFIFINEIITHFLENLGNNKKIDRTNFFLLVINFIRINLRHFSLMRKNEEKNFGFNFSMANNNNKINYIIENICNLIILINNKYKISIEFSNAIINDLINNFLFNNGNNNNNEDTFTLVLKTLLIFINDIQEKMLNNKENKNFSILLKKETLENFLSLLKENKTFKNTLNKLSENFDFFAFMKILIESYFTEIGNIYKENDQSNFSKEKDLFDCYEFVQLNSKIFQIVKIIKLTKPSIFDLLEFLLNLTVNFQGQNPQISNSQISSNEILVEKILISLNSNSSENKENKENKKAQNDLIYLGINSLVKKIFMQLENIYPEEFNFFLIKFFEKENNKSGQSNNNNNNNNNSLSLLNIINSIENYKDFNNEQENLFNLFVNLNSSNVNSIANSIKKIDDIISKGKLNVVKFTFNSLGNKFINFEGEFILKKILEMENILKIIETKVLNNENNDNEDNYNNNSNNEGNLKEIICNFFFQIFEKNMLLRYSPNFIEILSSFILKNFINDPNDELFNKFFIYYYIFNINNNKDSKNSLNLNKFLNNLINKDFPLHKKIDEFLKNISSLNSIKCLNIINKLINILIENKNINKENSLNLKEVINKIHTHENKKFKNNCSSSIYLKIISSIIEILINFNFYLEDPRHKSLNLTIFVEEIFFEISKNLIDNILFHKDFLNLISEISFLILISPYERIRNLFDRIMKFIYPREINNFLTFLIFNNISEENSFFNFYENFANERDLNLDENYQNTYCNKFLINFLAFAEKKIFENFEDESNHESKDKKEMNNNNSKNKIDFGFLMALIYLINFNTDKEIRKKIIFILEKISLKFKDQKSNNLETNFLHFNSLFGLVDNNDNKIKEKINHFDKKIGMDIIKLILSHKNEIILNKENLQKALNSSNLIDENFYFNLLEFFTAYSDEYSNFNYFYKANMIIENKILNKNANALKIKGNNNNNFNKKINEEFPLEKFEFIREIILTKSIENNPNFSQFQEKVFSNVLDLFNTNEKCLAFVINNLLKNLFNNNNNEFTYSKNISKNLIKKISESDLLEKIEFYFNEDNNNNTNKINFFNFISLLVKYEISPSNLNHLEINYIEALEILLEKIKETKNNNNNIYKEICFFIFELILKENSFSFDYAIICLEYLMHFSLNEEIDSNYLIMANNLLTILTSVENEFLNLSKKSLEFLKDINNNNDNNDNKINSAKKFIANFIEKIIIIISEKLSKKEKNISEEFHSNLNFSNKIFLMDIERENNDTNNNNNNNENDFDNTDLTNNSFAFEYLNILNTLFLSFNKIIILLNSPKYEKESCLRIIQKTFEIFGEENNNNNKENFHNYEVGYKLKKDIFSVILNSIINFIISLLGNENNNNEKNISNYFDYIQNLVKLTIQNFEDEIYLDNILKKLLTMLKNFNPKLTSCLFANIYFHNIETNYKKYLANRDIDITELKSKKNLKKNFEIFSVFYDEEKTKNNYYMRMISNYFDDIVEFNHQVFNQNSVKNVLLLIEDLLANLSLTENDPDFNRMYGIMGHMENKEILGFRLNSFENLRNLLINLAIKLLNYAKRLFYFADSYKLKENEEIYNIVISLNNNILKNLKISNTILNKNKKENKGNNNNSNNSNNNNSSEINTLITNIFSKNLKTFEEDFFEILIETNILHFLVINLFENLTKKEINNNNNNEKDQISLRQFILQKYLNLLKADISSIQVSENKILSKNLSKAKTQQKTFENFVEKYSDNLQVFNILILKFDQENLNSHENINLIFQILSEIIIFSQKIIKISEVKNLLAQKNLNNIPYIIKNSKRLEMIISYLSFEFNEKNLEKKDHYNLGFYTSKFSIFIFLVKFFVNFEIKNFEAFNKFINKISEYLDCLYEKFFLSSNSDYKDILISLLNNIFDLVDSRSEYLSPIMENAIFKLSLFYEDSNYNINTSKVLNKIFETFAKKQLFDISFKAVKFAFKSYNNIIMEKNKNSKALNNNSNNNNISNKFKSISFRSISSKLNSILNYFNIAIKYSDKLVITDLNLKITKFIYRNLMDKNFNNTNRQISVINKGEIFEDLLTDLSGELLNCMNSLILKMNEKQFKILFEEFLLPFFKEEIDIKNPEDIDKEKVGNKYLLDNCIVTLQIFNELFMKLTNIFVNYFEKYKPILLQILNFVNSNFCTLNKNSNSNRKKERNFFNDEINEGKENNKNFNSNGTDCYGRFSYLNLSHLVFRNIANAFKFDKNVLTHDTIEELNEPLSQQFKFIYLNQNKYQNYFDETVKIYYCEIFRNLKNEDIFREYNEQILNLIREDHYQIRLFVLKLYGYLFLELKERFIMNISEIIPYVTESLEDQNEKVQMEAFAVIKLIEKQTGEDIKNYIDN